MTKLGLPVDTPVTNNVFHDTTIQMFDEPNSNLLFAFIKIREVTNLMEPLYRPNKGTLDDVLAGKKDKKGGPFLIQYAFDVRDKNPKGKIQEEPDFNPPEVVQSPPTIEKFVNLSLDMELEKITFEWCLKAKSCVQNLFVLNMERYKNRIKDYMDSFNEHVNILVKKILNRIRKYAVERIPPSRIDLMPGKYWVWSSFASKLKRIASLMILSYHVTDMKDLETRSEHEDLFSNILLFLSVEKVVNHSISSDFNGLDSR